MTDDKRPRSLADFQSESVSGPAFEPPKRLEIRPEHWQDEYSEQDFRIFHAKWEEVEDYVDDKSIHLILTDPPFGMTSAPWDTAPDWDKLVGFYRRVLVHNGQLGIYGLMPMLDDVHHALLRAGFDYRYEMIRVKNNGLWTSWTAPTRYHENIWFYARADCKADDLTFNDAATGKRIVPREQKQGVTSTELVGHGMSERKPYRGFMHPGTVHKGDSISGFSKEYVGHPTQKPVVNLAWLIKLLSNEGDMVMDTFLGSGSTGVAARQTGRRFIGMEMKDNFYEIAKRRLIESKKTNLLGFSEREEGGEVIGDTIEETSKEGEPTSVERKEDKSGEKKEKVEYDETVFF
jgi:site-specific DNA-methyltransferase (adenine-specific)